MQTASDIFLGWLRQPLGLRTSGHANSTSVSLGLEDLRPISPRCAGPTSARYGRLCAWTLARAHARSGDSVAIAGYLGPSQAFDHAIAAFAEVYADRDDATTPCSSECDSDRARTSSGRAVRFHGRAQRLVGLGEICGPPTPPPLLPTPSPSWSSFPADRVASPWRRRQRGAGRKATRSTFQSLPRSPVDARGDDLDLVDDSADPGSRRTASNAASVSYWCLTSPLRVNQPSSTATSIRSAGTCSLDISACRAAPRISLSRQRSRGSTQSSSSTATTPYTDARS